MDSTHAGTGCLAQQQPPSQPMPAAEDRRRGRIILGEIALGVGLPWLAYAGLRRLGLDEAGALGWSTLVPIAVALNGFRRRGSVDTIGLLMIATTLLSLLMAWASGNAFFSLVRASFVTFGIGCLFLVSLALERPALFYLARDTTTDTRADAQAFAQNWHHPAFRGAMRRLTLVWAGFLIGEALLRVAIAAIWPSPALVAATQLIWVAAPVLLIGWSVRAGRSWSGEGQGVTPKRAPHDALDPLKAEP